MAIVRSSSSVLSGIESCIDFMKVCKSSQESGSSSCSRLSMRSGGSIAALRTKRVTSGSGSKSLTESSGVEFMLMRAVMDGVRIVSVVNVCWRSSTFSCIGIAVSYLNVGPVVW